MHLVEQLYKESDRCHKAEDSGKRRGSWNKHVRDEHGVAMGQISHPRKRVLFHSSSSAPSPGGEQQASA